MRLPYPLGTHEEQPERRRHRIFFDEFFSNQFRFFDRAIAGWKRIEVVELTVSVTLGNLRSVQETVRARGFQALATDHAFDAVAYNLEPARSAAVNTCLCHL